MSWIFPTTSQSLAFTPLSVIKTQIELSCVRHAMSQEVSYSLSMWFMEGTAHRYLSLQTIFRETHWDCLFSDG